MREHSGSVYNWRLLINGLSSDECLLHHQLIHCVGPYLDSGLIFLQWYHFQWRLSSVCTAMSVHLPSYLSNLISSNFTILTIQSCLIKSHSQTVLQSYNLYFHTYIRTYIHTFMHINIHAYTHSCIYNMHTISFIHDCISHP